MSTETLSAAAQGVAWDLSDLYASPEDPRLAADLARAREDAKAFETRYKPLFSRPGAEGLPLAALLADYKKLAELMTRPGAYARLAFCARTDDAALGAFLQRIEVELTDIGTHLLFFEVGWNRLEVAAAERLLADPAVAPDRHYLLKMRDFSPYTLSEPEERVLALKSNTSGGAFRRLFDEALNRIPFTLRVPGRPERRMTEPEVLALFHSPDRAERKAASEALGEGLAANSHLLTYVFNMVLADHRTGLKLRGYDHPSDGMNLSNEITLEAMLALVERVRAAYPLAMRYYRLKRSLLGVDRLEDYDRYAPVDAAADAAVPFDECRRIVVDAYRAFSPDAGRVVERFFERRWIDAEVRPGKRGGAFCCPTTPDLHPYVLVNYTGRLRDVLTVAHELGHGLHQTLAGRAGVLEASAPLTLAETASVFGEMLVFERLVSAEEDPRRRLGLLCGRIEDNFATVFRQVALTDFELRVHEAGLRDGELAAERIDALWTAANEELYGDSVSLTPAYRRGWMYIPHFVHSPFYCYAYAFAQLVVLSLYERYRAEGARFVPGYLQMLALGGSRRPAEVARAAGIDLEAAGFWDAGLGLLERLVAQAEEAARSC